MNTEINLDTDISVEKLGADACNVLLAEYIERVPFWCQTASNISECLPMLSINVEESIIPNLPNATIRVPIEHRIPWPSLSWNESNAEKNTTIDPDDLVYSRRLRFSPNMTQRKFLDLAFGNSRYIYNKCVEYTDNNPEKKVNETNLRSQILPLYETIEATKDHPEWFLPGTPRNTLTDAIKQYVTNHKAAVTSLKNGHIKKFKIDFMKKKARSQWAHFRKGALRVSSGTVSFSSGFLGKGNCKLHMYAPDLQWFTKHGVDEDGYPIHEFMIIKNFDRYYLIATADRKSARTAPADSIVALDPGSRTFQTFYDSTGTHGKIGHRFTWRLSNLQRRLDSAHGVYAARHKCRRLRTKISNAINDLHWKSAKWLTDRYSCIIIPVFATKQMVSQRTLGHRVNRELLTLSHFKFRQRLEYACKVRNRKLIVVSESYTSKTCSDCGNLRNVKGDHWYDCQECGASFDRDYNGARNILIKTLTSYFE